MANTRPSRLMTCNSWSQLTLSCTNLFWRLGPLRSSKPLLGSCFKIGFGRRSVLEREGWENCGSCPLCKQAMEFVHHLFVHCHYTTRLWKSIKEWIGLTEVQPTQWQGLTIKNWWTIITDGPTPYRKAMSSLPLLVLPEIWSERHARVFRDKFAPPCIVLDKIGRRPACGLSPVPSTWVIWCRESSPFLVLFVGISFGLYQTLLN
jgi:hypothetical protein